MVGGKDWVLVIWGEMSVYKKRLDGIADDDDDGYSGIDMI